MGSRLVSGTFTGTPQAAMEHERVSWRRVAGRLAQAANAYLVATLDGTDECPVCERENEPGDGIDHADGCELQALDALLAEVGDE